MRARPWSRAARGSLFVVVLAVASACGGAPATEPTVGDGWAASTPPGAANAAFYLTITNNTGADDVLVSVAAPVCARAELHRTTMTDGVMSMTPATEAELTIVDGEELVFEPGDLHVMCLDIEGPLVEGQEFDLQLTFRQAGTITAPLTVERR